jgi:hypothetical protein
MNLIKLTIEDIPLVEEFCNKCKELGWINNSSLKAIKFESTLENGGGFFGILTNDQLVSIAGYHKLPEVNQDAWRIFFRSATLPMSKTNKSLHREPGPRGRVFIDAFLEHIPSKELYVTTNVSNNEFERITRYDRSLKIASKMKESYVTFVEEIVLYNTTQSLWKLDVDTYLEKNKK